MKNRLFFVSVLASLSLLLLAAGPEVSRAGSPEGGKNDALVERGKYLVNFGGCNDCHSPKVMTPEGPVPDQTRLLSGHQEGRALPDYDSAMVGPGKWVLFTDDLTACIGPWGKSYSANLTPDEVTGIGLWTPEIFIAAMRTGKHMGTGKPISPPMPWFDLKGLTDEDLRAIFAYLHSLPPVRNRVPLSAMAGESAGK